MKCHFCDYANDDLKRFSDHVKKEHKLSSEEYAIDVFYDGKRPTCKTCDKEVRYVSYSFKNYCKEHAKLAMVEGGSVGGKAQAWNKGKTKETDTRLAKLAASMSGQDNPFYGKTHSEETVKKISMSKTLSHIDIDRRLIERQLEFRLVSSLDDYRSRQKQYLEFQCVTCGEVQPKTLQAFERGSRCYKCYPISKSNWEIEVYEYVRSKFPDTKTGDRTILSPKEIDVFVPSKNFGIECHGLYWHSEGSPHEVDKKSHLNKLLEAQTKGVKLIQFFYDEWRDKQEICKSIIDHKLNAQQRNVGARVCKLEELTSKQQREFFDASHISGYSPATKCFGLLLKDEIVAALSLRKPRQAKYSSMYEICRFATAPGTNVQGGLSRLLSVSEKWVLSVECQNLMTYVDRRFGDGHGYVACGFHLQGHTGVDYWYTDNMFRYDRFKYRATGEQSEVEVVRAAQVSKIWGCGSLIFTKSLC